MNLTRWEPMREMEDMFSRHPSLLLSGLLRGSSEPTTWRPAADISETDQEYLVTAELPGVAKKDVKIQLNDGVLTISGERKLEREQSGENQLRVERLYGSFARSFVLPDNVDTTKLRAESKEGLLLVHIPKKTPSQQQSVNIEVT